MTEEEKLKEALRLVGQASGDLLVAGVILQDLGFESLAKLAEDTIMERLYPLHRGIKEVKNNATD